VVVPLLDEELPMVEAWIAGCGPVRCLVDTAMELTLLDAQLAARFALPQDVLDFILLVEAAGGGAQRLERTAWVEELRLGDARVHGLAPPLWDLASLGLGIDVVLGQDVLGDWAVLFDAAQRRLALLPSEGLLQRLEELLPAGTPLESIAMHGEDRVPCITLDLHGHGLSAELHVDTGSTATCLPAPVLARLATGPGTESESKTLAGTQRRLAWRFLDFPIGAQRVAVNVEAVEGDHGLLGYDALRQRVFVVDGPGRRLLVAQTGKR
jgi:hypothetical protein